MSEELEQFKRTVEAQKDELKLLLARVGLAGEHQVDILFPDDDQPLTELYYAAKLIGDNIETLYGQLEGRVRETEAQSRTIREQRRAIQELSTPVIEIWEGILIAPLVGSIDDTRAHRVLEQLLAAIKRQRAFVAVIDITGVPEVDPSVAAHLVLTAEAASLLGAECVLTGISPDNAQILLQAGVNDQRLVTKGSLQKALDYAFKKTKRRVVDDGGKRR
jgi:anti-anti-sigma regulatory factor